MDRHCFDVVEQSDDTGGLEQHTSKWYFFVFFYKTTSGCIYLQKLVDVVPNKGTPLVSLVFHIKLVKAFVQNAIVGSFGVVKPFLENGLKIIYLTFLLYYN